VRLKGPVAIIVRLLLVRVLQTRLTMFILQDGVALVDSKGVVVDFVSYEGKLTAVDGPAAGMTAQELPVQQSSKTPLGRSIGLQGQGASKEGFTWASIRASPGMLNEGQTFKERECSVPGTC
jgi:hypothetical protein